MRNISTIVAEVARHSLATLLFTVARHQLLIEHRLCGHRAEAMRVDRLDAQFEARVVDEGFDLTLPGALQ